MITIVTTLRNTIYLHVHSKNNIQDKTFIYIAEIYAQNTIHKIVAEYLKRMEDESAPHDRVVWNIGRVQNNGARSRSDDVTANRVRFEIVAQVNITESTGHTMVILLELFKCSKSIRLNVLVIIIVKVCRKKCSFILSPIRTERQR